MNILVLMCDQLRGDVFDAGHVCHTPHLDRLAARGVRFTRAYTPNAVCSPARASLMTGRLPHAHGVLTVTHTVDDDQCSLRTDLPHWAQHLEAAGYQTGYFGKWHVERSGALEPFGWQQSACEGSPALAAVDPDVIHDPAWSLEWHLDQPPGYSSSRFYGAVDALPEQRRMGSRVRLAHRFLDGVLPSQDPWCLMVSLQEPHDPFVCGTEALSQYDIDAIELPASVDDDLVGRPGIYRKAARVWAHMTPRQRREAAACYYASITEIDALFGTLLDRLQTSGQLDDTLVVLTSDHGELLGAHGLYCKNFTGAEEVYRIPMTIAGPGVEAGQTSDGRVGLHDLGPTLLALSHCEPMDTAGDSRSFLPLLQAPTASQDWQRGYAEYFGGRMLLTQRVIWDGDWKFVFNGFDEDELYHLGTDPHELDNRITDPTCRLQVESLCRQMWERCRTSGDASLLNSQYPILRVAPLGPEG
ncbi:MAG: sulfatase-like hydrolase/transferase [Gemmatimonadetes bacterium]|jgi:arylsulfatase A-like enzyme|nr:sulfatase-like hydrolase/transferase [Gemmatimonadota bacterium]MBT6144723.1 sulfatase-like hydrolase/transferase [Gemmatimonadota bacterium]MBT7864239.1 sulfatase-like hydrolase/transferase [Gemmatimonadota bacterium]